MLAGMRYTQPFWQKCVYCEVKYVLFVSIVN